MSIIRNILRVEYGIEYEKMLGIEYNTPSITTLNANIFGTFGSNTILCVK